MNTRQQIENQRKIVAEKILAIRSLRKGSINEQWFPVVREGKKTEDLRGPYFVFTYKSEGKTVSERLQGEMALARAREDAANHQQFKMLCAQLEALTLELGELERREGVEEERVKKSPNRPRTERRGNPHPAGRQPNASGDLEAMETALKAAVLQAGARLLEEFMNGLGVGRRAESVPCPCGGAMASRGIRRKEVLTLLGPVQYRRSLFQCPKCGSTRYPGDEALDLVQTSRSPGVQRQVARLGAKETFHEVACDMEELAGIRLSRKDAERIAERVGEDMARWYKAGRDMLRTLEAPLDTPKIIKTLYVEFDGTGVPMTKKETQGRKGNPEDGTAKTREAKPGCVFTQTKLDEEGRPVRDPASPTFTGAIEPAAPFGTRIYCEAVRRGLFAAMRIVVITDGAEWIRNIVQLHFSNAVHIVDLYHARQHLIELCRCHFDRDIRRLNRYKDLWWEEMDDGNIEKIIEEATAFLPKDPEAGKDARREIAYFQTNIERMRYKAFREKGFFVGSGVIEAGCKTVIGKRLKQSGMEWTVRGANAIIALGCVTESARLEDYWEQRVI